ncbi:hypothetical protein PAHAL_9G381800 [Panicum hallii]|uniref:Uncharacterized protein n=1 Tax=Panicum hallii TaxID=206008 RepID=A0A2S3IP21_9POAL|nr:TPD1 protein homolog 1B-like [Panicum hallii]PAN48434.1 hypothetical protein PAHAL_9G381800 [Panicum hallii]
MDCPLERASVATVIAFLLLLACHGPAGVIAGGEPPYSSAAETKKHAEMHARKMLINATTGGHPRGVAAAAAAAYAKAAERTTAALDEDDDCSEGVVQVSQVNAGPLPNGIPTYSVAITNTCLDCTVRDVHVSCGEFASTVLVDPRSFRRLAYGDCLVGDGGPIGPGETVCFEYSNSFIYSMDVASVSCGDI